MLTGFADSFSLYLFPNNKFDLMRMVNYCLCRFPTATPVITTPTADAHLLLGKLLQLISLESVMLSFKVEEVVEMKMHYSKM